MFWEKMSRKAQSVMSLGAPRGFSQEERASEARRLGTCVATFFRSRLLKFSRQHVDRNRSSQRSTPQKMLLVQRNRPQGKRVQKESSISQGQRQGQHSTRESRSRRRTDYTVDDLQSCGRDKSVSISEHDVSEEEQGTGARIFLNHGLFSAAHSECWNWMQFPTSTTRRSRSPSTRERWCHRDVRRNLVWSQKMHRSVTTKIP